MNINGQEIKIFSGNANPDLAAEIAGELNIPLGRALVTSFSDGEIAVNINETVRGADVFVVQPTCPPVNEHWMELLIMLDAMKRASAGRVTAVMPYYGYARQDRKAKARDPITAKLVADLLTVSGADRILTMDLHAAQIQGFFNIPVDHLLGTPILAEYFKRKKLSQPVIVSPDMGSVTRTRNFAHYLDAPIAIIDKRRPKENVSEVMNIIGEIKGRTAILVDDMIDTAGTICQAADALTDMGAEAVYASCTHPVFSGPAIQRIRDSSIKELVATNTIPLPEEKQLDKITIVTVAPLISEAIERIYSNRSVSTLFD